MKKGESSTNDDTDSTCNFALKMRKMRRNERIQWQKKREREWKRMVDDSSQQQ